jgi:ABC-type amino acid transport substrate-binding protein
MGILFKSLFFLLPCLVFAQEKKKLKIISEETPFHAFFEVSKREGSPTGQIIGSDVAIITNILTKLNVPFEIQLVNWFQLLDMLRNGQADLALGLEKIPQVRKIAYFSKYALRSRNYHFYGLSSEVQNSKSLTLKQARNRNWKVGIMVGYRYPSIFWDVFPFENKILNKNLEEGNSYQQNIIKLKQKKINLFLADQERMNLLVRKLGADEIIFQYKNVLYWKDFYISFSKKSNYPHLQDLKKDLDREIYKRVENDEIPRIHASWIQQYF